MDHEIKVGKSVFSPTHGKLFRYVSPAFLCGFVLIVALFVAESVSSLGAMNSARLASGVYLMILTGIWLGTVFWFAERFLKAFLRKEFVFAIGFASTLAIFVALNVRSYIVEKAEFVASRSGLSFSIDHDGFGWGFPLQWFFEGTCYPCDPLGAWTVNWFLAIGVSWLVGTLLQKFVHTGRLK